MKKKLNLICSIIIIIVGLIDIIYGINFEYSKYKFIKDALKEKATIYEIVKNTNNNVIYIKYYINNKQYDNFIVSNNKKYIIGKTITIYYSKSDYTKITDGSINKNGYYIIILGLLINLFGIYLFIKEIML